jgi:hypothetical protein
MAPKHARDRRLALVRAQLDRYGTWPALALPKGNKPRRTQL